MKMNIARHLLMGGIVCAGLASCSDDANDGRFPAEAGNAVHFAASSPLTRTIYDDENIFQINWENGDAIRIYSNKAYEGVADANYTVTPIETAGEGSNKLYNTGTIAASGEDQLVWADNNVHKFIGVYPNDNAKIRVDAEQGIVTLPINRNQYCELVKVSGNDYYPKKYSGYTYYAKPDMKNAYLVAYNALTPDQAAASNGNVFLNFKPVMTAIEVVVKGHENANDASVQVTGISINRTVPAGTESSTSFEWNAATGTTVSALPDNYTGNTQITSNFVGLKTADGTNAVTLNAEESIVFTVFLPPYAINDKWPIKVRVHATGAAEVYTKDITKEILASNKRRVTLPNFKTEQTGNNWITPLDDNIYVSQLSIPGTHDAATGDGTTFSLGKTQELTLDQQFEMGIRAFDLRPALNADKTMILCHGIVATTFEWDQVMERFKYYLQTNPGEFIIAIMRHEDEYQGTSFTHWTNENTSEKWMPAMQTKLETMKNTTNPSTGESYTIDFRPDLTIGEMRGKILFMCRDWTKYNNNGPVVGGYHGWSHSKDGAEVSIYGPSSSGTLNVQDCYNRSEAGTSTNAFPATKWAAIETLLEKSRCFHTDPAMINRWSYNHTSGYTSGVVATASSTDGYRENAANNHIKFYNKITAVDWVGSTGIIFSDFVGARTSGDYTVYGDLLPQAIINNNYKYTMKRKEQ